MPVAKVKVEAQSLEGDGRISVRFQAIPGATIQPGQLMLGCRPSHDWHCHPLIPIRLSDSGISALLPEGAQWPPGSTVNVRGPIGEGFQPPEPSRRWLLISIGRSAPFLRPLIDQGLAGRRELAYVSDEDASLLPPAVEILANPQEGLAWADYVAVATPTDRLDELSALLNGSAWPSRGLADGQVLVTGPVPCGIGGCQACTVQNVLPRRLLCVAGGTLPLGHLRI